MELQIQDSLIWFNFIKAETETSFVFLHIPGPIVISYSSDGDRQPAELLISLCCTCFVGVFTLVLTNPIWVTKTRLCLQYDAAKISPTVQFYSGMFDCLCKTYRFEGLKGLYKASCSVNFNLLN